MHSIRSYYRTCELISFLTKKLTTVQYTRKFNKKALDCLLMFGKCIYLYSKLVNVS